MKSAASLALALLTATGFAQTPSGNVPGFADPANLMGERVKPKDGRELPIDQGASGLAQLLRKLNTRASILNIVAHPDDEDGGMLTYYSRGLGARVADISLTRGEGGQNAVTGDFENALGLLRTQELLANDRYTGVDQMFGTEADFGFSKTKEEAFAKWTHERVLYDVVRAIRLYRPLVLTSTWVGGVTDGHGQHQVSGEIAQEAFVKAGDPSVFPEMIAEGILPWSPLKIYARVPMQAITPQGLFDYATGQYTPAKFTNYVTGEVTTTPPSADVIVPEGQTDPLLTLASANPADLVTGNSRLGTVSQKSADTTPLSYVQFARIGLGLQKSQIGSGFRVPQPGKFDVAYHLYGSHADASTSIPNQAGFFEGLDTRIEGIATLAPHAPAFLMQTLAILGPQLRALSDGFTQTKGGATLAPGLAEGISRITSIIQRMESADLPAQERASVLHELRIKQVQLNDALSLALGLQFDGSTTEGPDIIAASRTVVTTDLRGETMVPMTVSREWLQNGTGATQPTDTRSDRTAEVSSERRFTRTLSTTAQFDFEVTRPYFARDDIESPVYRLLVPSLRNAATTTPALTAWATVDYRGIPITMGRIVHMASQPVRFVPAVNLSLDAHAKIIPDQDHHVDVKAIIGFEEAPHLKQLDKQPGKPQLLQGKLFLHTPNTWVAKPATQPLASGDAAFSVTVSSAPSQEPFRIVMEADTNTGEHYTEGFRPVGYGDLPRTNDFFPAQLRLVRANLAVPARHKIAYLAGTGDAVPEALSSVGLMPTMLTVVDLTPANLAQYDTVILGVRTYAAHSDLHGDPTQALIDYARRGGNVVVQYQTTEFTAADAPYPLALGSNEKVVDETAPVRLIDEKIDPAVRLFYAPNHITPADFDHWIEERGHGFLSTWDPHYSAPTETHDPGQDPQRGGLVTVKMGDDPKHQGRWTYCAFALYRQLPEAVPGAYRLFMNLIEPE